MNVQVHYQGLDSSSWADQFMKNRIQKLKRFFNGFASVHINIQFDKRIYLASIQIHNVGKDFIFHGEGENLYEAFTLTLERAARSLSDHRRMLKNKVHKRYKSAA